MVEPIRRVGDNRKDWTSINVKKDTRDKLRQMAQREKAQMSEILRYLVDAAVEGEIEIK